MSNDSSNEEIPVAISAADKIKIKNALLEISSALQFIEDRRSLIKDIIADLNSAYKLPKKVLSKMARTFHKQNIEDVTAESQMLEFLYEGIFGVVENASDAVSDDHENSCND